jgi:DNA-binding beta-propeller fold protein YncE
MYKIPVNDFSSFTEINLYNTQPVIPLNTHVVNFSPDGSTYYVTCQDASEVRAFQQGTDKLLAIIPVGGFPQEMDVSATNNYLFVTCQEDTLSFPGKRGSIAVIDMTSNTLIKTIYSGWQPHGISVDDSKNMVYIANRNVTAGGPAPHHSSGCGGKDGYVTFIDMNTLTLMKLGISDKTIEVSVDPYETAVRH